MSLKQLKNLGTEIKEAYEGLSNSLLKTIDSKVSTLESDSSTYQTEINTLKEEAVRVPDLERANKRYVIPDPEDGTEEGDGKSSATPLFSIKKAVENAPDGTAIMVAAGIYEEEYPINAKSADISVIGDGLRATIIRPTSQTKGESCFYANTGFYTTGFSFEGHVARDVLPSGYDKNELTNEEIGEIKRIEGAFAVEFPPARLYDENEMGFDYLKPDGTGTNNSLEAKGDSQGNPIPNPVAGEKKRKIFKSPYIQNNTCFTQPQDYPVIEYDKYEPGTPDQFNDGSVSPGEKYTTRLAVAGVVDQDETSPNFENKIFGGGGMKIDGDSVSKSSPIRSMVVDSFTQIDMDGIGCVILRDGYAQLVSFFGTFCHIHVLTKSGGICNLTNSTTDFGTYGLVSEGESEIPIFSAQMNKVFPVSESGEKQYIYFDILTDSYSLIDYDIKFIIDGQETQKYENGQFSLIKAETSDSSIDSDEKLANKIYSAIKEINQRSNGIDFEEINIYGKRIELIYNKNALTRLKIKLQKADTGELIASNTSSSPDSGFSGLIKGREYITYFPKRSQRIETTSPSGNRLRKGNITSPSVGQSFEYNGLSYLNLSVGTDTRNGQKFYPQVLDAELEGYSFTEDIEEINRANTGRGTDPYNPGDLSGIGYKDVSELFGIRPFNPISTTAIGNARFDSKNLISKNAVERQSDGTIISSSSGKGIIQKAYNQIISGSGNSLESNFTESEFQENVSFPLVESIAKQVVNQGNFFITRAFEEVRDWLDSKSVSLSSISNDLSDFVYGNSSSLKNLTIEAMKGELSNPIFDDSGITQVSDPDNDSPCSDIASDLDVLWQKIDELVKGEFNDLITESEKEFGKIFDASNLIERNLDNIILQIKDNSDGSPWDQIKNVNSLEEIFTRNNDKKLKDLIKGVAWQMKRGGNSYIYEIANQLKLDLYREIGSLDTPSLNNAVTLVRQLISSVDSTVNSEVIDSRTLVGACLDAVTINPVKGHQDTEYGVLIEKDINGEDKPIYRDIDGTSIKFPDIRCQSACSTVATYWEMVTSIIEDKFKLDNVEGSKNLPQYPPEPSPVDSQIIDGANIITHNTKSITDFISNNLSTVAPNFDSSLFNNNNNKCTRDLKYFIHAITWDMARGGNERTIDYGRLSYKALSKQADSSSKSLSELQTEYNELMEALRGELIASIDPTYHEGGTLPSRYSSFPYTLPSPYPFNLTDSNDTECANAKSVIHTLVDLLKEVINNNSVSRTPRKGVLTIDNKTKAISDQDLVDEYGVDTRKLDASAIITHNKSEIVNYFLTNWDTSSLNDPNLLSNNSVKCERDLGYYLDAIAWNLKYTGNDRVLEYGILGQKALIEQASGNLSDLRSDYDSILEGLKQEVANQVLSPSKYQTDGSYINGSRNYELPPNYQFNLNTNNTPNNDCDGAISTLNNLFDLLKDVIKDNFSGTKTLSIEVKTSTPVRYPDPDKIRFFNRSQIITGGHTMEYVGSGTDYSALPWYGGNPIEANEVVERVKEGVKGKIFATTQNQFGNFKINSGVFEVDGITGEVSFSSDSFNLSNINSIGAFKRKGVTVGTKLNEVSNNVDLRDDIENVRGRTVVPTQFAVHGYVTNKLNSFEGTESINTLGTISTGQWEATPIEGAYIDAAIEQLNNVSIGSTQDGVLHGLVYSDSTSDFTIEPIGVILTSNTDSGVVGSGAEEVSNFVIMSKSDYDTNKANNNLDDQTIYLIK